MSGHDGCGCGHGHTEMQAPTLESAQELPVAEAMVDEAMEAESCGDGCGCGHGSQFGEVENATLQGFLTGLYASTMDHATLVAYFEAMGKEEGSPFAKPAQLLADAMSDLPADGEAPAHVRLLELVSGEAA